MNSQKTRKMIAVVGPTASGKSDLAVYLASKFGGEVISADSRQVYKGLDIGTGKVPRDPKSYKLKAKSYFYKGIPHHLLDVASPKQVFTVSKYKTLAEKALEDIWRRGKLPIVCGGTGLYIRAIVDNLAIPEVPPDKKLREKLEKKSAEELFAMLKKLDPRRAGEIDVKNPRRLIRAIEIAKHLGNVPPLSLKQRQDCEILEIGIAPKSEELKNRIHKRLLSRLKSGMVEEAKNLHRNGLTWKRMEDLGLEYRFLARYLQNKITKKEMIDELEREIWRYTKRQMTWFKKDKRIRWLANKDKKKIQKEVRNFLN